MAKALKLEPSVAGVHLARAVDSGRLQRAERGLYTPVTSVMSLRPGTANVTDTTRNTPQRPSSCWTSLEVHPMRADDLEQFAVADGLLVRLTAEPGHLSGAEKN